MNKSYASKRMVIVWDNDYIFSSFKNLFKNLKQDGYDIILIYHDVHLFASAKFYDEFVGEEKLFYDCIKIEKNLSIDNYIKLDVLYYSLKVFCPTHLLSLTLVNDIERLLFKWFPNAKNYVMWPHISNIYHYKKLTALLISDSHVTKSKLRAACRDIRSRKMSSRTSLIDYVILAVASNFEKLFAILNKLPENSIYLKQLRLLMLRAVASEQYELFLNKDKLAAITTTNSLILKDNNFSRAYKIFDMLKMSIRKKFKLFMSLARSDQKFIKQMFDDRFYLEELGPLSKMTRIQENYADNIIVFSEDQVDMLKKIYPKSQIVFAKYPVPNSSEVMSDNLLFLPSVSIQQLNNSQLDCICRSIRLIIARNRLNGVSVKFHPRTYEDEVDRILDYLRNNLDEVDIQQICSKDPLDNHLGSARVIYTQVSGTLVESLSTSALVYVDEILSSIDYNFSEEIAYKFGYYFVTASGEISIGNTSMGPAIDLIEKFR